MQSRYPQSQEGTFPVLSNTNDLNSAQDSDVPVYCPPNGPQGKMVAPVEHSVAKGPSREQQSNALVQQHFQVLHHQQETQGSTGFQRQNCRDRACNPQPSHHQISKKARVAEQHIDEYCPLTSLNKFVCNTRPEREYSGLSNYTIEQQRHLNSEGASSIGSQGDGHTQSFVSVANPLLFSLLTGNSLDFQHFVAKSSAANTNIGLNNATDSLDGQCKSQQMNTSLAAGNCETYSTKEQLPSSSFTDQLSAHKVLSVEDTKAATDDLINAFIAKKVAYYKTLKNRNYTHTNEESNLYTLQSDNSLTTSFSDKERVENHHNCTVIDQCTTQVGQIFEEDCSKGSKANAELTPKSKEMDDCTTVASEEHSTGTQVSAVEHLKHTPNNESVEQSASVNFALPLKKHLDVAVLGNCGGKLSYSEDKTLESSCESFHSKCYKWIAVLDSITTLRYSLTALKELIGSLENVESFADMENFSKVILQKYWHGDLDNVRLFASTEYPQIMMKVAATCTKNEDESPVVLTSVSGMTLDELKEKHSSLMTNCSLPPEAYKSPWLIISSNLDNIDKVPGVSWGFKCTVEQDSGYVGQKTHMAVGQDSEPGVTNVSEDFQTKSSSVVSKNKIFDLTAPIENQDMNRKNKDIEAQHYHITCREVIEHSKLSSSVDTSWKGVRKDLVSMCSQTDLNAVLLRNELKKLKHLEEHSVNILKDPQYEDISDDLPEHPQYEDISDDENSQIINMAVETPSLIEVREPNTRPSFENEGYGHVQGQAQKETEIISDEKLIPEKQVSLETGTLNIAQQSSCPCFVETEDGFEHQAANISITCSPSPVLIEETNDQMDDNWIVIPLSMSELTFESEDGIRGDPEKVVLEETEETENNRRQNETHDTSPRHCELKCQAQKPVSASTFSVLEVFDTVDSFRQAKTELFCRSSGVASGRKTHDFEIAEEPCISQNKRESYSESEDSCDTEDSCDYSSVSERNYLTVPMQLLRSATLNPEADDSESEKESEHEATNVQKVQNRTSSNLDCTQRAEDLIETKASSKPETDTQKISEKVDLIIIDSSDTEDECAQNYRKTLLSSGSVGGDNARKCGHLIDVKGCSEHVQQKTNRQTSSKSKGSHYSDRLVKKHISKKKTITDALLSASVSSGSALFDIQNRHSIETVKSFCGAANEMPNKKTSVSSKDSPEKLPHSVNKEADSNPVISRLYVCKGAQSSDCLKLSTESEGHRQGKAETLAPMSPTETRRKTDLPEKNTPHLYKNRFVSRPKPVNDKHCENQKVQAQVTKPRLHSRQLSLPNPEGPSISKFSSTSIVGQLCEPRRLASSGVLSQSQTYTFSGLSKFKESTSVPRRHMSSSKRKWSHSSPSAPSHPNSPTKAVSSANTQSSARKQVTSDWHNSFFPTRRDKKICLVAGEALRNSTCDSSREERPGPIHHNRAPRRRHSSYESAPPLMKKTKCEALQLRKAMTRDTPREEGYSVGAGYKKLKEATKDSSKEMKRRRFSLGPYQ